MLSNLRVDRRDIRKIGSSDCGAAAIEYAILLGVLICGGVIAYLITGVSANHVYQLTGQVMSSTGTRGDSGESHLATSHQLDANGGLVGLLSQAGRSLHASIASAAVLALGLLAWGATMALGMLIWRFVRMKIFQRQRRNGSGQSPATQLSPGAFKRLVEKRQQIRRLLTRDLDTSPSCETQVRHLMSRTLTTVRPNMKVADARSIMRDQQIRHLLVCLPGKDLVGIISDRDINERDGRKVADIMTPNPCVAAPEMEIGPAVTLMLNRSISCLPVVQRGRLRGVLTTTDLLLSFQCLLQVLAKQSAMRETKATDEILTFDSQEVEEDLSMLVEH